MNDTPSARFDLTFIVLGIQQLSTIKPTNIVEIGSRDGYDTNYVANHFGINHNQCIVFEPNPVSCKDIINKYPNFKVFNNAISSESTIKDLYIDTENIGACSLLKRVGLEQPSIKVECIDMDSVISNLELDHIDICKIDTEGTILDVLKSFGKRINIVRSIQLESDIQKSWKEQILYPDIKSFLQDNNFIEVLYCRLGNTQVDAFWINEKCVKI